MTAQSPGDIALTLITAASTMDELLVKDMVEDTLYDLDRVELIMVLVRAAGVAGGLAHVLSNMIGMDVMPVLGAHNLRDPL